MKNVILLFADDMRYGMISDPKIHTPNLDKLAISGIMYTNAHIPGGTSGAVCMPSRAMLHTGRLLEGLAKFGKYIPKEHVMLGEVLGSNGYETYGIGKWHNGTDSFNRSFANGAEIFFGGMDDHWNVPANHYDPTGRYDNKILKSRNPYNTNKTIEYSCDHITPGKHSSDLFADASIDFLKNNSKNKPFFLYTAFMAPHDPRTMPKEYLDMYDFDKTQLPDNFMPVHPFKFDGYDTRDERLAPHPRTESIVKRHLTEYYAMVTHLDACIGRILETVKEQNLMENTIIIFASDNGLAVGSHGLMGKQNLYEHSIRVPMIISGPGIPKDSVSDTPVYIADLYPTILNLLNIGIPKSCTTQSIVPDFSVTGGGRETMYLRYKNSIAGIKKDGFKLIKFIEPGPVVWALYDYVSDPLELNNLVNDQKYTNIFQSLQTELEHNWKALNL